MLATLVPEDHARVLERVRLAAMPGNSHALRGETFRSFDVQVRRLDTGRRWMASYGGTPVYDRDGNQMLAIVTLRDITDQHETSEQLRTLNEFLEQRVRERTVELQKTHEQLLHAEKMSSIGKLSARSS